MLNNPRHLLLSPLSVQIIVETGMSRLFSNVKEDTKAKLDLSDIPVVSDFPNVFKDESSGLLPNQET